MSVIAPLPSSTPSSAACTLRAPDQPARADDQRLVQDDEPAQERQLRIAGAVDARIEPLGRVHDPAVRMAQGDGDRVAAAHQHTLDQGLAAVGEAGHARSLPAAATGGRARRRRRGRGLAASRADAIGPAAMVGRGWR